MQTVKNEKFSGDTLKQNEIKQKYGFSLGLEFIVLHLLSWYSSMEKGKIHISSKEDVTFLKAMKSCSGLITLGDWCVIVTD